MKTTYTKCESCSDSFSCFFRHATEKQKTAVMMEVIEEATEKQKAMITETALALHQSRAGKARWSKRTPEERSAHGKMMVTARDAKRLENKP